MKKQSIWSRDFICVFLSQIGLSLSHFAVNPLVSSYATHLGAQTVLMGVLTGMFFGISLAMRPIAGPLTTKVNKRILLICVNTLGGLVNIGYALFHSIPAFIVFRVLHGIQYSIIGSLNLTIAGECLPEERLATGMGIFGVGSAISTAIGPRIGVLLHDFGAEKASEDLGYTLVFAFAAVILLLAVIPSVILRPRKYTKEQIASTGAWYKNIISLHALPISIIMIFLIMSYSLFNSYLVPFGAEQGIAEISVFFTVLAVGMVVGRMFSGRLTEKHGYAKVCIPAIIVLAISYPIIGMSKTLVGVLISAIFASFGYATGQPALQAMCVQSEPPVRCAVATNTLYVGMDLGFFLGPLLGSIVVEHSSYATMYTFAFIPTILAMICFIIFWPSYRRRREKLKLEQQ